MSTPLCLLLTDLSLLSCVSLSVHVSLSLLLLTGCLKLCAPAFDLRYLGAAMRIFAVSDIHTDHKQNLLWVRQLLGQCDDSGAQKYSRLTDVIIVAGDVTHKLDLFRETFELFVSVFAHVFWCPGNHDLYLTRDDRKREDSLAKLERLFALCAQIGVHTRPARLVCESSAGVLQDAAGVWIVPVLSWHHSSFDTEPDITRIGKRRLTFDGL